MIANIDPAVKKHPDLYDRVAARLRREHHGRNYGRWGDSSLAQQFNGWVKTAEDDGKPGLESFFAMLAAHGVLCKSTQDRFSLEVEKRGLMDWAREQLQPAKDRTGKKDRSKKKSKKIKVEVTETSSPAEPIQSAKDIPLQSIESDPVPDSFTLPGLRPSCGATTVPSPEPPAKKQPEPYTSQHFAVEPAPKRHKATHEPAERQATTMIHAATQTDPEMPPVWVPPLLSDFTDAVSGLTEAFPGLTEALRTSFQDAISQQTEVLTQIMPETIKATIQEAIVEEAARQRGDQIFQPAATRLPVVEMARPRSTYVKYEPQATPARRVTTLRTDIEYEDPHVMEARLVSRRGATGMGQESEGFVNLAAFRYLPDGQGRRL